MKGSPMQIGVWTLLALATVAWLPYVVTDFTIFGLFESPEMQTVLATLLAGLGVYDLAETFGFVEYP